MRTTSRRSIIPGFSLTLGLTFGYLSVLVILPLAALVIHGSAQGLDPFIALLTSPRVQSALTLSLGTALAAALINLFIGLVVAWTLVRYRFPGRPLLDALIDLPFALPTAVAGISLTTLCAPQGALGKLAANFGISLAFTPLGIILALVFVTFPFVVRTVQPVLEDLNPELEEAAATLGAGNLRTFVDVLLPALWPALLTGFTMAFARALGEYGSIVFISGNMPLRTEVLPLLIMNRLEQFDHAGASALALIMLIISFVLLLVGNILQTRLVRTRVL